MAMTNKRLHAAHPRIRVMVCRRILSLLPILLHGCCVIREGSLAPRALRECCKDRANLSTPLSKAPVLVYLQAATQKPSKAQLEVQNQGSGDEYLNPFRVDI